MYRCNTHVLLPIPERARAQTRSSGLGAGEGLQGASWLRISFAACVIVWKLDADAHLPGRWTVCHAVARWRRHPHCKTVKKKVACFFKTFSVGIFFKRQQRWLASGDKMRNLDKGLYPGQGRNCTI